MLPNARTPVSRAAAIAPARSAKITSAPAAICLRAAARAFSGSNHESMKSSRTLISGLASRAPARKALIVRCGSGSCFPATMPTTFDSLSLPARRPHR